MPRGAAIQSEITRNKNAEDAPFSVVPINRENIASLREWPVTGWAGHYHWFSNPRGPKSNLIRTGDRIDLVIWDNQQNSLLTSAEQKSVEMTGLTVSSTGTIFVPYLNEVPVRGKTPEAARDRIASDLELVVPAAQVQLSVSPGPDNSIDAVRGFASPGTYPLPNRNYSLLSLISAAGGISESLQNPLVRVIREGKTFEIRADTLFERASTNVVMRGGDKIIVEEDERYFVALGATGTETIVPFNRERITAIEALALLGGISDNRANPQGVLILREYSGKQLRTDGSGPDKRQVVFTIDLTSADGLFAANKFQVNPRDLVVATESPVNSVRTVFGLIGAAVGVSRAVTGD
ncbi:polysaccharide biosynthesis/export family protein [uncultured Tateyamaria sp.]|uniref:polysaccharide biosynthesis/export family protein n=1 Tax=Tateyamaria sp. 1078 TaxID=3417464 RepID=UPI002619191A|nr:polysaccharide biosynthesis/export family protein [uncultured Tateyamaria sp.]